MAEGARQVGSDVKDAAKDAKDAATGDDEKDGDH
jgi:hypothetical protein